MKKLALVALTLAPLLTACGGGDKKPAGAAPAATTSANALVTPHNGPCPVLNGKYVQLVEDQEETVFLQTQVYNGVYGYSFLDPAISSPQFHIADAANHGLAGDPNPNNLYRISCDARSISYVTQKQGEATIAIRFYDLGHDQIQIEAQGGGEFLAGVYTKVSHRR